MSDLETRTFDVGKERLDVRALLARLAAAPKKLLAEWFWTDRWMGSSGFLLPMEPRGLYRELLTQAWRRGGRLPTEAEALQRACGASPSEWRRSWPAVSRYWQEIDGELVNETQLEVMAVALAGAEGNHSRAKAAADRRWGNAPGNADGNAQASTRAVLEECPPSLSPSRVNGTPQPPRDAGGGPPVEKRVDATRRAELRAARLRLNHRLEMARQAAVDAGITLTRRDLRVVREWLNAGYDLGAVATALEQGNHRPGRI